MDIQKFHISGLQLIKLKSFHDDRGFFVERYKKQAFSELGLPEFVQDNFSRSKPSVLRGLHYQWDKPQGKLVTVLKGHIFDVAVDIRQHSPTFGQHVSVELKCSEPTWFWIPAGFAHGFCVLGNETADVMYKVDNYWNGQGESGIVWNDLELNISWPMKDLILSPKDLIMQNFSDYKSNARF